MRATAARAESRGVLVLRTTARNCATSRAAPHPPCRGSDAADDSRERALRRKCNCTCQTDVDRDLACKSDVPTVLKVTWPSQMFFAFFPQPARPLHWLRDHWNCSPQTQATFCWHRVESILSANRG